MRFVKVLEGEWTYRIPGSKEKVEIDITGARGVVKDHKDDVLFHEGKKVYGILYKDGDEYPINSESKLTLEEIPSWKDNSRWKEYWKRTPKRER